MSYLFINPVNFLIENAPCHSIPLLMGILKHNNIENALVNLNSKLIDKLKNRDFINEMLDKFRCFSDNSEIKQNVIFKGIVYGANTVYTSQNIDRFLYTVRFALYFLKSKMFYYNLGLCHYSYMLVYKALSVLSLVYSEMLHILIPEIDNNLTNSNKREIILNIELLEEFYSSELNIFKDFFDEEIEKMMTDDVECVGISINSPVQLITGLYLCRQIKNKYNCHINIGGAFFNEYYSSIKNLSELFVKYFDSISIKNNTETIIDTIKHLRGEINITDIPNIIYYDREIKINGRESTLNFANIPYIDLGEPDNLLYPLPYLVLPIQASTSCYWGKCIFCDCSSNNEHYTIKTVERLVDEIEYLKNKYKTKYFYFWDNALHPNYLNKLADELNKRKIKIFFSIYARFEPEFTLPLLKKLRKAGLGHICWGIDSASKRVLDYIKKGIDINVVERVLKDAKKANIYNKVYLIFGHPTETIEEVKESINFVNKNSKYIGDVMANSKVLFLPNSIIQKERDYYKSKILTSDKERADLVKTVKKNCCESIIMSFSPTGLLLLDKYSVSKLDRKMSNYLKLQKYKFYKSLHLNIFNLLFKIIK